MVKLQLVLVQEIQKRLDNALFSAKVNLIKEGQEPSEFEKGFIEALNHMEGEIEDIFRYFEVYDILKNYQKIERD